MAQPSCTDDQFIAIWREQPSPLEVSKTLGITFRRVLERRRKIEAKRGISLVSARDQTGRGTKEATLAAKGIRRTANLTGQAVVFSDAHFWPGEKSAAYKALLEILSDLKPAMVICNGDAFDGARISRHGRIGWENRPTVSEEIDACREAMDAIRQASRRAQHVFNYGNHDIRFARFLANNVGEFEGVAGMDLHDHIRHWEFGWSLALNNHTMIKHRLAGGVHANHNNTLKSGWNIFTGHLHYLKYTMWHDYNGTRYGGDTGTLANVGPEAGHLFYAEDSPTPGSGGFMVLTFTKAGMLLEPEICRVANDGHAYYRGERVI